MHHTVSIFCSYSSFEIMKNYPMNEEYYGCMTDFSYGDLDKEVVFSDNKGTRLSIDQFLFLIEKNWLTKGDTSGL